MTSKSFAFAALALCAAALVLDFGALALASFAMRPESDDAAGVVFVGSALAILADVAALVVAIVALVRGRRDGASIAAAIVALVFAVGGFAFVPIAGILWILFMTPIGIH